MAKHYTGVEVAQKLTAYRSDGTRQDYSILQPFSWSGTDHPAITVDQWATMDAAQSAVRLNAFVQHVADAEGWDVANGITNAAERTGAGCTNTAILTLGASTPVSLPASGGDISVPVVSTYNGTATGWTLDAAGSRFVAVKSGEGTANPVFTAEANTGAQRSVIIAIRQTIGTKTASKAVTQAAAAAPALTGYIGIIPDVDPPTEADILALPTFAAGNGDVYHGFDTDGGRCAIVQPASLPSYTHAINHVGFDEIPGFKEIQMSIDGVMCKVLFNKMAQYFEGIPYYWTFKK